MASSKAQAEIIIIVGLIVVAVVVFATAFQSGILGPQLPPEIAEQHSLLINFVSDVIREGAVNNIQNLEKSGGYLTLSGIDSVQFSVEQVPYWQKCDAYSPPSIASVKNRLEAGIEAHLEDRFANLKELYGKDVNFDTSQVKVEANILDTKIDLSVTMPAEYMEYPVRQPYRVSVPTRFGRIYNFASDFSRELAQTRQFETFTLAALERSTLPTYGGLTECGQSLLLTPLEISEKLTDVSRHVILNTGLWTRNNPNPDTITFGIERVNGKTYADLNSPERIRFSQADNGEIQAFDPIIYLNIDPLITTDILPVPSPCIGNYLHKYSFSYPVIVTVSDPGTGTDFRFASFVSVEDSRPSTACGTFEPAECGESQCQITLSIMDSYGQPVRGAGATFAGCFLGESNEQGVIDSNAACGENRLNVYHTPGYEIYSNNVESSYNAEVTLHTKGMLTFHFVEEGSTCFSRQYVDEELVMLNMSATDNLGRYLVVNTDPEFDPSSCGNTGSSACQACAANQNSISPECMQCTEEAAGCTAERIAQEITTDYIPGGTFRAGMVIMNPLLMQNEFEEHPHISIPIQLTSTEEFQLPETDADVNIILPDSDAIYAAATARFNSRKADRRCLGEDLGPLGCAGHRETDEEARAVAFAEAYEYIKSYSDQPNRFRMEACP